MEKKYLHEMLPTDFLNEESLKKWSENSADMDFFGLTPEIINDVSLLTNWFKNFMVNTEKFFKSKGEDELNDFITTLELKHTDISKCNLDINFLNDILDKQLEMQPTIDLFDKDSINSGVSPEELKEFKVSTGNIIVQNLTQTFENYSVQDKFEYVKNVLPIIFENFEKTKKDYFSHKINELSVVKGTIEKKITSNASMFDPNNWNSNCFNLFNYLVENYTAKDGKTIKYINIWYFLKRVVDKKVYTFTFTQEKYMLFIKDNFDINIKKFAKAEYDFDEQKSILYSLEIQFRGL